MKETQEENSTILEIPSSSGREKVVFFLKAHTAADTVSSDINLFGSFWNQSEELNGEVADSFSIHITNSLISTERMKHARYLLDTWMSRRSFFNIDLSHDPYEETRLEICQTPDLIFSLDKPVFRFRHHRGSLRSLDIAFVVDQSCIRIAIDSIDAWVSQPQIKQFYES